METVPVLPSFPLSVLLLSCHDAATGSSNCRSGRDLLFEEDFVQAGFYVHPDGNTFLTRREEDPRYEMVIVFNWFEEVRRRMAELGGR